ncbi:MAG: hypothetical protein GQ578_03000, partial [Desulfuromonadaceae bacterium]|nr:hypothetical protein [Desulfuromonadaceae bacterium]
MLFELIMTNWQTAACRHHPGLLSFSHLFQRIAEVNLPNESWLFLSLTLLLGLFCGWLLGRLQSGRKNQTDRENLLQQISILETRLAAEQKTLAE